MKPKISYKQELDQYSFCINKKIYSLNILLKAAYLYIDLFYVYFSLDNKDNIRIYFTPRKKMTLKKIEENIGSFLNELIHQSLRLKIYKETKNIRDIIIGRALYGSCIDLNEYDKSIETNNDSHKLLDIKDFNQPRTTGYKDDIYNIGVNWFEENDK